ncbi:hypothetical protein RG71_17310 [Escherichia coli]|nr:hypothetical protein RG71_17310 [Escherichia coli]
MFAGKKSAQIREILISESAWEEMTCLFAPSLGLALPGVAGIYNRSKFMVKKLEALELWTTYLNNISCVESKVTILKQKAG